jgi:uncharacterized protein (TIGR03435 family)
MPRIGVSTTGDRLQAESTNVWGLILFAYNVKNDQLSRGLSSVAAVGDTFYDVVAKASGE